MHNVGAMVKTGLIPLFDPRAVPPEDVRTDQWNRWQSAKTGIGDPGQNYQGMPDTGQRPGYRPGDEPSGAMPAIRRLAHVSHCERKCQTVHRFFVPNPGG